MTFDPIAWAARHGATPGPPVDRRRCRDVGRRHARRRARRCCAPSIPSWRPSPSRRVCARRISRSACSRSATRWRRSATWWTGDDPGRRGASAPGFASLLRGTEDGLLLLDVRRRPAAQSGRGLLVESFEAGCEALRVMAQSERACRRSRCSPTRARPTCCSTWRAIRTAREPPLGEGQALLILVAAGRQGEAAARAERAIAACASCIIADLGQNVARAWAGSRYDLASHAATLGRRRLPARDVARVAPLEPARRRRSPTRPTVPGAGRELVGVLRPGRRPAGPHPAARAGALRQRQQRHAAGDQHRAQQPHPADLLAEQRRRPAPSRSRRSTRAPPRPARAAPAAAPRAPGSRRRTSRRRPPPSRDAQLGPQHAGAALAARSRPGRRA